MGYYLDMEVNESKTYCCLGGKFFGYIEDEEFKECLSAKFLAAIDIEAYCMLNVPWSCVSFELNSIGTELFLRMYKDDVLRFKQTPYLESLDEALEYVKSKPYQIYKFSMG